jgi:aspartate dehydrogenase
MPWITPSRIAVIGYGAITDEIVRALDTRGQLDALACVLVRPNKRNESEQKAAGHFRVVDTLPDLLACEPQIVIEAAGHCAVAEFGAAILAGGCDLLLASVGALADGALAKNLAAAASGATQLWIASGAVAGIDGLLAARSAGLRSVTYTSLKGADAWKGTPAQALLGERAKAERVIFFSGSARQAALQYPQNANVGATIALASLGLDRTQVLLGSDPNVTGPLGIIEADGEFGCFKFEILALASATNPKTSALTGHSLAAAVCEGMCFRALDCLRGSV